MNWRTILWDGHKSSKFNLRSMLETTLGGATTTTATTVGELPCLITSLCNLHLCLLCCSFSPSFLSDNVALNTRWLIGNFSTGDWFTADHLISCHRQANFLAASNFALLLYCSFCSCVQTEPLIGRSIDLFAINFLSLSNSPALIVCLSDCFLCWQWSNGALFLNWSLS